MIEKCGIFAAGNLPKVIPVLSFLPKKTESTFFIGFRLPVCSFPHKVIKNMTKE